MSTVSLFDCFFADNVFKLLMLVTKHFVVGTQLYRHARDTSQQPTPGNQSRNRDHATEDRWVERAKT